MLVFLYILSVVCIIASLMPLLPFKHWSVRLFDFPRLQVGYLTLITLILVLADFHAFGGSAGYVVAGLLTVCLLYKAAKIYPYTLFHEKQMLRNENSDPDLHISFMNANILQDNRKVNLLFRSVDIYKPDVLLLLETDGWWEEQLRPLEKDYPYTVKKALPNYYGMILMSRLPLQNMEVKFLVDEEIPSMHGQVIMRNGTAVNLHCLHPMPPSPTEAPESTDRDAELMITGKYLVNKDLPTVVIGDLNDVAWSVTSTLFQKVSGLLDPRIGRGFYSTFHAKIPLVKWPLDHLFISRDFRLVKMKRPKKTGSDHYPMYAKISYEPARKHEQVPEPVDHEDMKAADRDIREAL